MRLKQVAAAVGVSTTTLTKWLRGGQIPDVQRDCNGKRIFSEQDLEAICRYVTEQSQRESPDCEKARPRRLIETFLPQVLLSEQGAAERYSHGKTPHSAFVWWARRPFAAMRGIIAAALIDDVAREDSARLILHKSVTEQPHEQALAELRQIASAGQRKVLDLFAGGSTIPFEAAALGADAWAVDNNEMSHFILQSLLNLSQTTPELPHLIRQHGRAILDRLSAETDRLFPQRTRTAEGECSGPVAYFWSRSTRCEQCRGSLSLQKRPWLSKKAGRPRWIRRTPEMAERKYSISMESSGQPETSASAWQGRKIVCPFCERTYSRGTIKPLLELHSFEELTAVCLAQPGRKSFHLAMDEADYLPASGVIDSFLSEMLQCLNAELPELPLPVWTGIVNPPLYGLRTFASLLNPRQTAVMLALCRELQLEYEVCRELYGEPVARPVVAFLSGLIDQLADWNCRLCMWIPQNEQVGRALSGPGLPMMWDYVETDPLLSGPANLWDKLERIARSAEAIPRFPQLPHVTLADARELPFKSGTFDAVITDPPYFDNLFYHVLADCIYVWKRLALRSIFPDGFKAKQTNQERELSANKFRHSSVDAAADFYSQGMTAALREARRVLKPDGVLVLIFAQSSLEGWASLLEAFTQAGIILTASWELHVERKHRPRGLASGAVQTSFALVGRAYDRASFPPPNEDWPVELEALLKCETNRLASENRTPAEIGMSLFGVALSYASAARFASNSPSSQQVLRTLTAIVSQIVPEFTLLSRSGFSRI